MCGYSVYLFVYLVSGYVGMQRPKSQVSDCICDRGNICLFFDYSVRVHDECNGSDVFGTDICTCRPYLIFAIKACIECAQRGGVGVVAYFRKEGRSLGEITKYRVYNVCTHVYVHV